MGRKISFKEWIDENGVEWVAKKVGVTPGAVHHWRTGRAVPYSRYLIKIKDLSGNRVSVDQILQANRAFKRGEARP